MPEIYEPPYSRLECSTAVGQLEAVRNGAGIGILHDYAAHRDEQLQIVLPAMRFDRTYWLVTHASLQRVPRVRAAIDFMLGEVQTNNIRRYSKRSREVCRAHRQSRMRGSIALREVHLEATFQRQPG